MTSLAGKSLIGTKSAADTDLGDSFSASNPATGEPLAPPFHFATTKQVEMAASLAAEAFSTYRNVTNEERGHFLRTIAANIESLEDSLVRRVMDETALPKLRVTNELRRTVNQLCLFAAVAEEGSWVDARIDLAIPDRQPIPRADIRSMLCPLGPVAVFGASNFPLAFSAAGGDTASALAAGCTVVVKAHSAHPGVSELVAQAIIDAAQQAGMPNGVYSLLFGPGSEVGVDLVRHPAIKAVGFTGSLYAGRSLFDIAVSRDEPIPVYAEMGSVNPVFLLPDALAENSEKLAAELHQSATLGVGQFCTNPGLVFYDGNESFRTRLIKLFEDTPQGCMLTSGIATTYREGLEEFQDTDAVQVIASSAHGESAQWVGSRLFETNAQALIALPSLADELFGPSTLLVRCSNLDEMVQVASQLPGQLTASVHATQLELASCEELLETLRDIVGRVVFNQFPTGVEVGHAMVHGGPFPASTDSRATSVGTAAIQRFVRPICYQNFPDALLPPALQDSNPLKLHRLINGKRKLSE